MKTQCKNVLLCICYKNAEIYAIEQTNKHNIYLCVCVCVLCVRACVCVCVCVRAFVCLSSCDVFSGPHGRPTFVKWATLAKYK